MFHSFYGKNEALCDFTRFKPSEIAWFTSFPLGLICSIYSTLWNWFIPNESHSKRGIRWTQASKSNLIARRSTQLRNCSTESSRLYSAVELNKWKMIQAPKQVTPLELQLQASSIRKFIQEFSHWFSDTECTLFMKRNHMVFHTLHIYGEAVNTFQFKMCAF